MKYKILIIAISFFGYLSAQKPVPIENADKTNTWLKVGANAALPIFDLAKTHKVGLGVDASVQFLETKASGIGIKVGYINYFAKDASTKDVSVIPLAIMYRYYPTSKGWFAGLEVGYAFLSGVTGTKGGYFVRPQIGLHYYNWNYFAYYDHILVEETAANDIQAIGVGVTYNLRFK